MLVGPGETDDVHLATVEPGQQFPGLDLLVGRPEPETLYEIAHGR
jgi:hypothetical protein